MYRVWFSDLDKALAIIRDKIVDDLFCSIEGTAYGDFIFRINDEITYIVKHDDFTVWRNYGNWREPDWRQL